MFKFGCSCHLAVCPTEIPLESGVWLLDDVMNSEDRAYLQPLVDISTHRSLFSRLHCSCTSAEPLCVQRRLGHWRPVLVSAGVLRLITFYGYFLCDVRWLLNTVGRFWSVGWMVLKLRYSYGFILVVWMSCSLYFIPGPSHSVSSCPVLSHSFCSGG